MCEYFWENIYRILVFVRNELENKQNIELLNKLIISISNRYKNDEMVKIVTETMPKLGGELIQQNGEEYNVCVDASKFVVNFLHIACEELEKENFEKAYEVIDILHMFPHVVISNRKRQTRCYCKMYVKPIIEYAKNKGYEVKVFKKCRMR